MAELANDETKKLVLTKIPQQPPFRFVDKITELSDKHCIGEYTYKEDEFFYKGHFPSNPVTPGVILIETMLQIGLLPIGLYHGLLKDHDLDDVPDFFFSEGEVEFKRPVLPLEKVTVKSNLLFFRSRKLKGDVVMINNNEDTIAYGTLAGFSVNKSETRGGNGTR